MTLDTPLSNFPSATWLRELRDMEHDTDGLEITVAPALPAPSRIDATAFAREVLAPFTPLDSYEFAPAAGLAHVVERAHAESQLPPVAPFLTVRQAT